MDKNTNKVVLQTELPTPETYTFYENPAVKTEYLENPVGVMLKTNLDPRYLINAIYEFAGAQKIEILLTEMSVIPRDKFDKTVPRYVDTNMVGVENLKLISLGPLLPNAAPASPETTPDFSDISLHKNGFWQTPVYLLRVTNSDGSKSYYKAVPISTDGSSQSG